jgi:oxazoline/thiazoline dehydrogenase
MSSIRYLSSSDVRIGFRPGVSAVPRADDRVEVQGPLGGVALAGMTPGVREAIRMLDEPGSDEWTLENAVRRVDGDGALPVLHFCLQRLDAVGALSRTLVVDERPLATVEPVAASPGFLEHAPSPDVRYVLSRFAYLRRDSTRLVLETPLARCRLVLHDWRGAAIIARFAFGATPSELVDELPGISEEAAVATGRLLLGLAALTEVDEDGRTTEEADPALCSWEAHDLLFHTRSRRGRHDRPYGGTYRLAGSLPPSPAVKPPPRVKGLDLYRPDLDRLAALDSTLTTVIERRSSVRVHGPEPITALQLGEFLYRVARLRHLEETEHGQLAFYPYPSGGASSELTLYAVIDRCEGVADGIHQYAPDEHVLYPVCGRTAGVELLLREAAAAMKVPAVPQVLIVVAARFQRVSWKYESMAYSLILKHVGVLYQQMYLVATAMGLAACGIGGGDSDAFAAAVGTRYYEETSVGEFALGSSATTSSGDAPMSQPD